MNYKNNWSYGGYWNEEEPTIKKNDPIITDKKTNNVYGIMIMNQKTINDIYKNSGPLAVREEFQMHYTALTTRIVIDDQFLFINVPILFYNYEQFVSSGSISFNYGDVQEISDAVMPLAQAQAQLFLEQQETQYANKVIKDIFGVEPNWEITTMHTMHRHPGQMDNFSEIDYQKNFNKPGIVFPIMECEPNTPSFSSIICDYEDTMKLVHTECRIVSTTEEEISYEQGKCISFVSGIKYKQNFLDNIFGIKKKDITTYTINKPQIKVPDTLTLKLLNAIDKFNVDCTFIEEKNVKRMSQKSYKSYSYNDKTKDNLKQQKVLFDDLDTNEEEETKNLLIKSDCLMEKYKNTYMYNDFTGKFEFNELRSDFDLNMFKEILLPYVLEYGYEIQELENMENYDFFVECLESGLIDITPKYKKG